MFCATARASELSSPSVTCCTAPWRLQAMARTPAAMVVPTAVSLTTHPAVTATVIAAAVSAVTGAARALSAVGVAEATPAAAAVVGAIGVAAVIGAVVVTGVIVGGIAAAVVGAAPASGAVSEVDPQLDEVPAFLPTTSTTTNCCETLSSRALTS